MADLRRKKRKKPDFRRQDSRKYARLDDRWRRPRGIDSKMRHNVKGHPRSVKVGYRKMKEFRGLHPSGFEEVLVYRPEDVDAIDPDRQAARIGHTVGAKKRISIVEKARETGVKILNPQGVVSLEFEESEEIGL